MWQRIILLAVICIALVGVGIASGQAQRTSETDFLSGLEEFRNIKNMLPEYVNARAKALLAERTRKIASFTSAQQITERKAYIRAHMMQALGGPFPERTPLNARTVGVLER